MRASRRTGLSTLFLAALASGCVGSGQSGPSVGEVLSTPRGAEATLRGEMEEVVESTEEVFRFLDISYGGRSGDDQESEVRGFAGTDRVIVGLQRRSDALTDVLVRVRTADTRWNRSAARGILEELRRYLGS